MENLEIRTTERLHQEMQEHLNEMFTRFSLRTDLMSSLFINQETYQLRNDVCEEEKWLYYNWVCRELRIKDKIKKRKNGKFINRINKIK